LDYFIVILSRWMIPAQDYYRAGSFQRWIKLVDYSLRRLRRFSA